MKKILYVSRYLDLLKAFPRRKCCNAGDYFPFKKKDLLRLMALL